jgi:hypothetical protein
MSKTIEESQREIETALQALPNFESYLPEPLKPLARLAAPNGFCANVRFRHASNERGVKKNAPAEAWSPSSGLISISYEQRANEPVHPVKTSRDTSVAPRRSADNPSPNVADDSARDVLVALSQAEHEPELGFVALKWFRDVYLTKRMFTWAGSAESRQRVLADAINRRWILTSKIPNPKNPAFPVTAIRVNRSLPEVRNVLHTEQELNSPFAPIQVRGELLSDTVIRERR